MWIVMSEEFNPDPILKTLLPSQMAVYAPRLCGLVFCRSSAGGTERYCLYAQGAAGDFYTGIYDMSAGDQYEALKRLVRRKNPPTISLNFGSSLAHLNGLAINVRDEILAAVGEGYRDRIVSSEPVALRWLETRTQREIAVYRVLTEITRSIVRATFSSDFIKLNVTTTEDVEWRMRELMTLSGFSYWFGPDVDLQRRGEADSRLAGVVIEPGDILHCDLGLAPLYIPLHTDMQQIAYVRRDKETVAPSDVEQIFGRMKRSQEIIRQSFKNGRTGNEMFFDAVNRARSEGIDLMLYTHPIGYHGHGAGPCLGRYTNQGAVKGQGEFVLNDMTCYALEHNVSAPLCQWDGQRVFMYIEEDIFFDGQANFLNGCQDSIMLI